MNTPSVKSLINETFKSDDYSAAMEIINKTDYELSSARNSLLIGSICQLCNGDLDDLNRLVDNLKNDVETLEKYITRWNRWRDEIRARWAKSDHLHDSLESGYLIAKIASNFDHKLTGSHSVFVMSDDVHVLYISPVIEGGSFLTVDEMVVDTPRFTKDLTMVGKFIDNSDSKTIMEMLNDLFDRDCDML